MTIEELLRLSNDELIKRLRKLSPEERIKKIKALEEARKKEREETEKLKLESLDEIETTANIQSQRQDDGAEMIDISALVMDDPAPEVKSQETATHFDYAKNFDYAASLYSELADAAENPSYESRQRAAELYDKIKNSYDADNERLKDLASGSRQLMKQLFGKYGASMYDQGR